MESGKKRLRLVSVRVRRDVMLPFGSRVGRISYISQFYTAISSLSRGAKSTNSNGGFDPSGSVSLLYMLDKPIRHEQNNLCYESMTDYTQSC